MTGSIVDLSGRRSVLPNPIVVDTNLIVERFLEPYIGVLPRSPASIDARRATEFFHDLISGNGTGVITPTVFTEFVHISIKFRYKRARRLLGTGAQQVYGRPIHDWLDLYKTDATILQGFLPELEQFRLLLGANGLLFLAPDELGSIVSGRTYEEELVHLVGTYGLDSHDALILMEAQRYGVNDIVSLDTDLQRAQADFNIYTWL